MPNGNQHDPPPPLWEQVKTACEYRDRYMNENSKLKEENSKLRRELDAALKRLGERTMGET